MPRGKRHSPYSLRVTDFSDRELLAIARDLQHRDGEIDIELVAMTIWPGTKKDADKLWHGRHCVAIRFAHMRRMGVLEKTGVHGKWELTDLGASVLNGHISAAQEKFLQNAGDEQSLSIMALIGDLYESTDDDHAALMRREFQFRAYRRRWR